MQDRKSDRPKPEEPASVTDSWHPGKAFLDAGPGAEPAPDDSPTVRRSPGASSGSASGTGSGAGSGSGSGTGMGRGPMEFGLPDHGDRLDCFEVAEAIGVGGMGAVFRALDVRLDRYVALKVLPPSQANEAENVRRFYQEGRAAARLDHENIARVFTIGQDKSLHYIAFEYIEGTTIRQRVEQRGPLPVAEAINFTLQIAGALVHASERGVIHRDIKPSNIIVTPHGRAKLVDMGLARRFEREGADDGLTQSNMTLGTFDYISPEQARDPRSVDIRSDLYSLGCTIYHMLTGQPPFPGGTVLQKLLSHREEPAPDVRRLNPGVPADLANIVLKLMAKEPDRRYQTPEQLVRDLLTLAGALGLRSISPEGLVWMSATPRGPGWERHLFWGLPAAVLLLVVGGLVWFGGEQGIDPELALSPDGLIGPVTPSPQPGPEAPTARPGSESPTVPRPPADRSTSPTIVADRPSTGPRVPIETPSPSTTTRERRVRSDEEDLRTALRTEPPGTTILLPDDGPYRLTPAAEGDPPIRADLTIRAADGARPVVELLPAEGSASGSRPLLHFVGGRVAIEGLTFQLGAGTSASSGPAIRAEGTALTLSRCLFRGSGAPASLELIGPSSSGSGPEPGPMPVVLETCTLGGGSVGISAQGRLTLGLKDCAVAVRGPAVWFNNAPAGPSISGFDFLNEAPAAAPASQPVSARLMLDHVSVLAGAEPILKFGGTTVLVEVSDSLFAPTQQLDRSASGPPTLVAIDDPDRLSWMGFGNLYARIGVFLWPTSDPKGRPRVFEFDSWASGSSTAEARSRFTTDHVWSEADPGAALARGGLVSEAFRPIVSGVNPAERGRPVPGSTLVGTRRGPSGDSVVPDFVGTSPTPTEGPSRSPAEAARLTGFDTDPMTPGPMVLVPDDPDEPPRLPPRDSRPSRPTEPVEGEAPPLNFVLTDPREQRPRALPAPVEPDPAPDTVTRPRPLPDPITPAASDDAIRTTSQFLDRLDALGPKGGVLKLASNARIDLPNRALSGSGIVEIQAVPGPTRPLLRLRPDPTDPSSSGGWSFLLRVDSMGELQLRGVDLVLDSESAPLATSRAAFGLGPGATLELIDCTVTIQGSPNSAVVRLLADEEPTEELPVIGGGFGRSTGPSGPSSPAHIRFLDSLLRSSGNLVDVAPMAQLDELRLSNVVASCAGSLVLGQGRAPRTPSNREETARLILSLRRATIVAHGGLIRLASSSDRPHLPVAEVAARESILATGPDGGALFRVEGQGELDGLGDRIRIIESREVAYHRIDEYRRDQSSQPGTLPVVLDRDEWSLSVGRDEGGAQHGDVGFLSRTGPDRAPSTLEPNDLRLDPAGPAADLGPDLDRIPDPPSFSSPSRAPGADVIQQIRRVFPGLP